MKTSSPFGSYAFGEFASNDAELKRLERQATVAWPLEREKLLAAGLKPGMRVLDLACGPGFISRRIAAELGAQGEVIGIDLNDKLLEIAAHNASDWNGVEEGERAGHRARLSFQRDNVYALDLPDDTFDFVYARFLFQHLERPLDAISQARRVLKPGGRLVIADVDDGVFSFYPEPPGLKPLLEMAAAGQQGLGGDRQVGRKLPYYLKRSGFEDVTTDIAVISSDDIGLDAFLGITTRFKVELLPEEQRGHARKLLDGLFRDTFGGGAGGEETIHAMAGVYAVSGRSPAPVQMISRRT